MKYHEHANIFPLMGDDEIERLAASIKKSGLQTPIVMHEGKILDGRNRYLACQKAGVAYEYLDFEGKDSLTFVIDANLERRHLNESQRASAAGRVANLPEGRPNNSANLQSISQAEAAKRFNVSTRSVASAVKVQTKAVPEVVKALDDGAMSVSHAAKIADKPPAEQRKQARTAQSEPSVKLKHNTGDTEWYTPAMYVESARAVMGGIDVDPASSSWANRTVKAKKYFTETHSGLGDWPGYDIRVFMNPPYATNIVGTFILHLLDKIESNQVEEAVVLVNNATETKWFQSLGDKFRVVCFPAGRIKFEHPDKEDAAAPLQGQAIFYYGPNNKEFIKEFIQYGVIFWS